MPVHIRFLGKKIVGRSCKEVTRLFNERFGMSATPVAIRNLLTKNGLYNNHGRGFPRENRKKYLPHHIRFLKGIVKGRSYAEITEMFNKEFGFEISVEAMGTVLNNHNLKNGRDCRIKPGNIPPNKGKKGYCPPGSEKGWFQPGQSTNKMPIGSERINGDGYVDVKIRNLSGKPWKNWKGKHRIIWEKAHGKIPRGHVVIFADGDKLNFALENLLLVSHGELAVMNRWNLISDHGELTKAGKAIADIKLLIAKRKRKRKKVG
jgi:hypothetical protein